MRTIGLHDVGEVLARLYDDEINIRLEWFWDMGFSWALIDGMSGGDGFPRVLLDTALSGSVTVISRDPSAAEKLQAGKLQKDWAARGRDDSLPGAITALAEAAARRYPQGVFARWWRNEPAKTEVPNPEPLPKPSKAPKPAAKKGKPAKPSTSKPKGKDTPAKRRPGKGKRRG